MTQRLRGLLAGLSLSLTFSLSLSLPAHAQAPVAPGAVRSTHQSGLVTLEVEDHAPRFLAWYEAAQKAADADARWDLWQQLYGEAAVPPTPQGRELARRLLDGAWPRYGAALAAARAGAARIAPQAAATLAQVAGVLGIESPARIRLKTIIAAFERNAFAYRADMPVVVIPLETVDASPLQIAHEGTHALHMLISNLGGQWERSVAATALQEGLAMHVACEVIPGRSVEECVGGGADFWAQASAKKAAILQAAVADLAKADGGTVYRYTLGQGNAGLRREAYAIGWWVVEQMRKDGMTLAQVARIREADMPAAVAAAIAKLN